LTSDPRRISELTVATAELRFKFACCIYRDENGVHCTSFQKPCSKAIDGFFRLILWVPLVYAVHHRLSRNDLIRSRPEFLKRSHNTQEQPWGRMRSTAKNKMVSFAERLPPSAARKKMHQNLEVKSLVLGHGKAGRSGRLRTLAAGR
jgi:hypothetical protein